MYDYILYTICFGEGISPEEIAQETRKAEVVYARQLIFFFCIEFNVGTLNFIGAKLGKDHATVIHSMKSINNWIDTNKRKQVEVAFYHRILKGLNQLLLNKKDNNIVNPIEQEISDIEDRVRVLSTQLEVLKFKRETIEV